MKTLTITIVCGADRDTYKTLHHFKIEAQIIIFFHQIMYGKKYAKKGGEIFYEITETSLQDCIDIVNAKQSK